MRGKYTVYIREGRIAGRGGPNLEWREAVGSGGGRIHYMANPTTILPYQSHQLITLTLSTPIPVIND